MALKEKFEVATTVIGLASNLGLPVDILGGLIGGPDATSLKLDQIQADIARLQETVNQGFQDTNTNNFYRQIQQALATSQAAHLVLSNSASDESAKAAALIGVSTGLSDVVGAVNSLITTQVGVFTPGIVEDMYGALAFSLSLQINTAATVQFGEKVNGEYKHGGFLPFKNQIQAGIDAIESIKSAIDAHYFTSGSITAVKVGTRTDRILGIEQPAVDIYHAMVIINHNIDDPAVARAHYLKLVSEVVSRGDQDFGDDRFIVEDGQVRIVFRDELTPENTVAQGNRAQFYIREMSLVSGDLAYFTLTGEKSDRVPGQFFDSFYSWNDPGAIDYSGLVVTAEALIDGEHIQVGSGGTTVQGTEAGDFISGGTGGDTIFGNGGDDYLQDGGGNDFVFGGEGSDRYFSKGGFFDTEIQAYTLSGQDGFLDNGSETDVDVLVLAGNRADYTFYDDTGTTGPRVKIVKINDPESDVMRGIEILKFDDDTIAVSELTLLPKDSDAPGAPVIGGVSGDDSVVVFGTAEANSYVTVTTNDGAVAQTQTDENGVWTLDYGTSSVFDGREFTFTAVASDAVNNDSSASSGLTSTIDKLAPLLSVAELISSNANGSVARAGDTLTLLFTSNERLSALPDVTLAGSTAAVSDLGNNSFRAVVTLDATAVAGGVAFLISMTDIAGNAGTGATVTGGNIITIEVPPITVPLNEINGNSENNVLVGTAAADLIRGQGGNDDLRGQGANDSLIGGTGNDTLRGEAGDDTMIGGAGDDTYVVTDADDVVVEDVNDGNDTVIFAGPSTNYTLAANVEQVTIDASIVTNLDLIDNDLDNLIDGGGLDSVFVFAGVGNDTISNAGFAFGGVGNDVLNGSDISAELHGDEGNDLITGGMASEQISGGAGADSVDGGAGNDTIWGSTNRGSQTEDGGNDTLRGGDGDDEISGGMLANNTNFNAATFDGNDVLDGGAGSDTLFGGTGDDTIEGGTGIDVLHGGDGGDRLYGGEGNDFLAGGAGNDYVRGDAGNDTLYLGVGDDIGGGADGNDIIYGGAGANAIWGGNGTDSIYGGTGADTIYGGGDGNNVLIANGANDWIYGSNGNELIGGGEGNDVLYGGNGADRIYTGAGTRNFVGGGDGNDSIYGGDGSDTIYAGTGDDFIGGGSGSDVIYGSTGDNRIYLGVGNDYLVAGYGKDVVTGGPGADTFIFQSAVQIGLGAARDVITDFTSSVDKINLSALGTSFNGTTGLTGGGNSSFFYFAAGGLLIGDADGNGIADWVLELSGIPDIVASDFIL